jgi:TRAP-type C4-dicarboxylate transport system permease small subunit
MKTGLIAFGVFFLIIGGLLYFVPSQTAKATTTTVGATGIDTRTSYATLSVPLPVTYAVLLIGLVLLVLGFALPGPQAPIKQSSESSSTEIREDSETDDGTKRKVTHERHVEHRHTK